MIFNLASNTLVNQHGDINRTAKLLKDTSKCEFIVCSDLFMTASAKFADLLLPGVSMFEEEILQSRGNLRNFWDLTIRSLNLFMNVKQNMNGSGNWQSGST